MCCIQLVTGQLYAELVRKLLVTSLAGSYKLVLRVRLVGLKRRGKTKGERKYCFPDLVQDKKTKGRENKEVKYSPGLTKFHIPDLERKLRKKKSSKPKIRHLPLRVPI